MIWGIKTQRRQKRLPDPTEQVWRLKLTTYIIKNHFSPGSGGQIPTSNSCGGGGGGVLIDGLGPTVGDVSNGQGYGAGGGGCSYKSGNKGVIILDFIRDN